MKENECNICIESLICHCMKLCHFQGSAGLVKCNCFQHVHKPKCFEILAQDQRLTSLVWYTPWILKFLGLSVPGSV